MQDANSRIAFVRKSFPSSPLIVSTTTAHAASMDLRADKVIVVGDAGCFRLSNDPALTKPNNINRQIATTLEGLRASSTKYTLKLRSDFLVLGTRFLEFFDRFEKADPNYQVFRHKVLASTYFSYRPTYLPFCVSDMNFFGLTSDLINLYDIQGMQKEDEFAVRNEDGWMENRYIPEQHLFTQFLTKNGKGLDFIAKRDLRPHNVRDSERYLASNFVILNSEQFSLIPPARFAYWHSYSCIRNFTNCLTHSDWLHIYRQNVDNNVAIPPSDAERQRLEKIKFRNRWAIRCVKLLAAAIFWNSRLRQRARRFLLSYLDSRGIKKYEQELMVKLKQC